MSSWNSPAVFLGTGLINRLYNAILLNITDTRGNDKVKCLKPFLRKQQAPLNEKQKGVDS